MGLSYNKNMLSLSDSQIAETIIKHKIRMRRVPLQMVSTPNPLLYEKPPNVSFQTTNLNTTLEMLQNITFGVDDKGVVKCPPELRRLHVVVGNTRYRLGMGGLHSMEKKRAIIPARNQFLIDKDVAAYYPNIIMKLGLFPASVGPVFLDIYREILKARMSAKATNDSITNECLKIVLNGTYGKLGSPYSVLYSPATMILIAISGQLYLLMLIERLAAAGIEVVSANTDGFVSLVNEDQYCQYNEICEVWEDETGFDLETSHYHGLYSRDVNNYIAVTNTTPKRKGVFAATGLGKNPQGSIIQEAVVNFLTKGTPPEQTIKNCGEIHKFIMARRVTGGAVWGDEYLGKSPRWIYSSDGSAIRYITNGNKCADSDGAFPLMRLPADYRIPAHIDYEKYIERARGLLADVGYQDKKSIVYC